MELQSRTSNGNLEHWKYEKTLRFNFLHFLIHCYSFPTFDQTRIRNFACGFHGQKIKIRSPERHSELMSTRIRTLFPITQLSRHNIS